MFKEIFDDEQGLKREETIAKTVVPDLPMDDELFFLTPPSSGSLKKAVQIQRNDLNAELIGDCGPDPIHDLQKAADATRNLDELCKSGGKPGTKLRRFMKSGMTLGDSMNQMVTSFEEFFSSDERALLDKAIASLDLPLFFMIMNEKVYRAA